MAINSASVTGSTYLECIIGSLIISFLLPIEGFVNCIFMTIPFTSVLKLPVDSFSFITLLQLLLILRSFLSKYYISFFKVVLICIISLISQIMPIILFNQLFSNTILLMSNVLTFYCIYKLTLAGKVCVNNSYLAFSVGVLVAGFVSIRYEISVAEMQDFRFCGLWTDPNFWGMFCLLGIITCLIYSFQKPLRLLVVLPIILGLSYQGFLTLSRTFILVFAIMTLIISYYYLKQSKLGFIFVICIMIVGIYCAIPYIETLFTIRQLDNSDLTNGRYNNTLMIFEFVGNDFGALFFGVGYNNILNVMSENSFGHGATHNSYADILVDYGLVAVLIMAIYVIKNFRFFKKTIQYLLTLPGIGLCIILFYMGTLSMLKYVLLFIVSAIYVGYAKKRLYEKRNY